MICSLKVFLVQPKNDLFAENDFSLGDCFLLSLGTLFFRCLGTYLVNFRRQLPLWVQLSPLFLSKTSRYCYIHPAVWKLAEPRDR